MTIGLNEKKSIDVICAGILVYDIALPTIDSLPTAGELINVERPKHLIGGSAANTSIALAKLGKKVTAIGFVGEDDLGKKIISDLRNADVIVDNIFTSGLFETSQSIHVLVKEEDRRFIHYFGANSEFRVDHLKASMENYDFKSNPKIIVIGGFLLLPGFKASELNNFLKLLKNQNFTIVLDVAFDKNQLNLKEDLASVLKNVDYFLPNFDEACILTNSQNPEIQAKTLIQWGAKAVVITCGEKGSFFMTENHYLKLGVYDVDIKDGSGAGDAFTAGFVYGLQESWDIIDCLKFASVLAASVCREVGCTTSLFSKTEAIEKMSQIKVLT